MNPSDYTVVIATMDRAEALREVLDCLDRQALRPAAVVIVDASDDTATADLVTARAVHSAYALSYQRATGRSAARQRNQGAADLATPFVVFMDDDISFGPDLMSRLADTFTSQPDAVGVAGRIEGHGHPPPSRLLWCYYRLQAGYAHPHYGGRIFGAAINCFPCYERESSATIETEWLNSGLVMYRTAAFAACRFPEFDGYSFMEDVYASAQMRRRGGRLFFRADAPYVHYDLPNRFKRDLREIARHRMRNRERVAREVLGLSGWRLGARLLLHRLFLTAVLCRARSPGWTRAIAGTWS